MKLTSCDKFMFASFATILGVSAYNIVTDSATFKENHNKTEIREKDSVRYNRLINDGKWHNGKYWELEAKKMNDSIKTDSLIKKAYFEGMQAVRDSISKVNIKK